MTRGAIAGIAVAVLALAGCGSSGKVSYPQHFADEDNSTDVSQYQVAWEGLLNDCKGSSADIARYVDNAVSLFSQQHQPTDHLQVMTDIASAAEPVAPTQCDQIAAALLTIAGSNS